MRQLILLTLITILSSCGIQGHHNFNKQKYTKLKGIESSPVTKATEPANDPVAISTTNEQTEPSIFVDNIASSTTPANEELVENNQDNSKRNSINLKIKSVREKLTQKSLLAKKLGFVKKIKKKLLRDNGARFGFIALAILFLCMAALAALFAVIFIELGFGGLIWGVIAGFCFILFLVFLILGLIQ